MADKLAPVDPAQLEKCILAFELLGRLADADVPFIFKGGTAVLLRLGEIRRLSVDVDISLQWPKEKLEAKLADIGRRPPFIGWEERRRNSPPLPKKRHYYFAYRSAISGTEDHVILDVLDEGDLYPQIDDLPIQLPFIIPDHPITVSVPTVEGLLGDKLTAFAPGTVGLPYDKESPVDLIKQLFDVGHLFDVAQDLPMILVAYDHVFAAENSYRQSRFAQAEALDVSYDAALTLCSIDLTKKIDTEHAEILQAGVRNIRPLLVRSTFTLPEAKVAAVKVALISRIIRRDRRDLRLNDLRFDPAKRAALATATMAPPLDYLTKLRGVNDEAFHYWLKTQEVIE
ncbi:MAG: nucleotidyl transferase AbiEii/AbiGii toxin family protein [Verrucomicrobia bacterium]|nr:nucleotidyl transferase AbiEii/AbiGii toxin family protein [Verrucomicrobiota bacterium]